MINSIIRTFTVGGTVWQYEAWLEPTGNRECAAFRHRPYVNAGHAEPWSEIARTSTLPEGHAHKLEDLARFHFAGVLRWEISSWETDDNAPIDPVTGEPIG